MLYVNLWSNSLQLYFTLQGVEALTQRIGCDWIGSTFFRGVKKSPASDKTKVAPDTYQGYRI